MNAIALDNRVSNEIYILKTHRKSSRLRATFKNKTLVWF